MSEREFFRDVKLLLLAHLDITTIEAEYLAEHITNIHKRELEEIRQHFIALDASLDRTKPN